MQNFQNTFETPKRSFISAFSICMTVPLTSNTFALRINGIQKTDKADGNA